MYITAVAELGQTDMTDHESIAKDLIGHILGEKRLQETSHKYGLTPTDRELLSELLGEWKPGWTFEDIVAICQKYSSYHNIDRVVRAYEAVAMEAARVSTSTRATSTDGPDS